ncbi:DUF2059 domain-containing protein [Roseomonas gilardii subsp. gilardii]|uniref:DUF2059 domain-containing protein n=1 Tax=Roseomonas gilardii TaxID=257708 RepID=UPI001FF801CA|nr:DUF2059 domain-containing protein [Roseomonas gilardii]UPG72030.1 DUF2059 domain-containing protein [Roseomonas gilardii subsp. gilardii]
MAGVPASLAQPAPAATPAPAPDPEALDAAQDLIRATGMAALMDQMITAMRGSIIEGMQRQSPRTPAGEIRKVMDEVLLPEFRARLPELTGAFAAIYAQNFSAAELRELVAFYGTPLGQKSLRLMPQIMQQGVALGQSWGRKVAEEAIAKHRQELRRRGLDL